jgi:hypothetical protein
MTWLVTIIVDSNQAVSFESCPHSSSISRFRFRESPDSSCLPTSPLCNSLCPASSSISPLFLIAVSEVSRWMDELSRVMTKGSRGSVDFEKLYSSSASLLSTTVIDMRFLVGTIMVDDVCCIPAHSGSEVISNNGVWMLVWVSALVDERSTVTAVPLREDTRDIAL